MLFEILSKYDHNVHYLNRYIKFIEKCIEKNSYSEEYIKYEKHHICPKSKNLFPEYKSFADNPWNLAKLTFRQHYIAHLILSKIYINVKQRSAVQKAFSYMTVSSKHNSRKITARMHEKSKRYNSISMIQNNPMKNEETRQKSSNTLKALMKTERGLEIRKRMSQTRTGRCDITEEGFQKLRDRWTGTSRPKTPEQIIKNRIAISAGLFKTPFGDFYSPQMAADDQGNIESLSRHMIDKFCKLGINGYSLIPNPKKRKKMK